MVARKLIKSDCDGMQLKRASGVLIISEPMHSRRAGLNVIHDHKDETNRLCLI